MAMGEDNVKNRRRSLKGAVLYTVLAVMMVVLMLMLTTIALAGQASKRAYSEYADTQVVSTAQSFTDSLLETLGGHGVNRELGNTIFTAVNNRASTNDTTPYVLNVTSGGELGNGMGRVDRLEFSYAGRDNISGYLVNNADTNYIIMKVTAYVQMGSETTTYTEYLTQMDVIPPDAGGGTGGLLSSGPTNLSGTSISVIGPFGGGLGESASTSGKLVLKNEGLFTGSQSFNHGIEFNVKKLMLYGTNKPVSAYNENGLKGSNYQGISVLGDLTFDSSGVAFISKFPQPTEKGVPYVFVSGSINCGNNSVSIGTLEKGSANFKGTDSITASMIGNKVNIYCGAFKCSTQPKELAACGDLFCYDSSETSFIRGQNNRSNLITWAEYVAHATANGNNPTDSANMWKGNMYTKGNLKFGSSEFVVDGNVYVDRNLDLSDLNASAPGIPEVTGSVTVRGSVILPASEPTDPARKAKYDALVGKITTVTDNQFPADKELDQILGIEYTGSPSTGNEQLAAVNSGNYEIPETLNLANKIVLNSKEQQLKYYELNASNERVMKSSVSASGVIAGSPVYHPADITDGFTITESCTLKCDTNERFQNKTIYVDPNQSATGLWITLDNVLFDGNCKIICEDRKKDTNGNFVMKTDSNGNPTSEYEKVYTRFYIKEGTDLTLGNSDSIVTQMYYDDYFNHSVKLQEDLTVDTAALDKNLIPGIYLYSSNDETNLGHEDSVVSMTNNALVTAYVIAPTSQFKVSDGGNEASANVIYDGTTYSKLKIGIVGSAIVGSVANAQGNDFVLVYIPNDAGSGTVTPGSQTFEYRKIPGYSTYR